MVELNPATKFTLVFGLSTFLWLVPLSTRADRRVIALSLIGSIGGFIVCYRLSDDVVDQLHLKRNRRVMVEEINSFKFGLEELTTKQRLELQFAKEQQQWVAAEVVQQSLPSAKAEPQQQQPEIEVSEELIILMEWIADKGKPVKVREIQQAKISGIAGLKADAIRKLFAEAESLGLGSFDGATFTPIED